jgi:hypothetical protein
MGGGKDQAQANQRLAQQAAYQTTQQKEFDTRNEADLTASRGRADELYGSLKGGYESLVNPQTGLPVGAPSGGGGGGGKGGAPNATNSNFKRVEDMYKNYMDTGGWDPTTRGAQQGRIDTLTKIGDTGGLTEDEKARARGGGYYEEFAKTGGYSPDDIRNIRTRATSGIPAMFSRVRDESARAANVQGGYGPGRALLAGRLGREQAGAAADASLNAELGIRDKVNQGRQWGVGGMSSSELALQDLLTKNKLQSLTGASDIQGKMQESIMGGQQWGTGGLYQKAKADQAASRAAAAAGAANSKWQQEFALRQKLAGLSGLGGLYETSPAEYNQNKQFDLSSSQGYGGQVIDASVAQKTGNKSAWDTVGSIAGSVAGGMTGLGAIGAIGGAAAGAARR